MNRFTHFLRFGLTAGLDTNLAAPTSIHPVMPVVTGDALRWLVPVSDLPAIAPERLQIGIRTRSQTTPGTICGQIRRQRGEYYTEIRLRVGSAPTADTYRQFSLMLGSTPILGTFGGQQRSTDDYLDALTAHFEGYAGALVLADRRGRELRLRVYPNQRFSLNGEPLTIGLGTVTATNTNTPALTVRKSDVTLPAEDVYTLMVGEDITAGNIFSLNGAAGGPVTYTATGSENPADILKALGVAGGTLTVAGGTSVRLNAQVGRQVVANTNRPALDLLYDSTSGGYDFFKASVSPDVAAGNVYTLTGTGTATRSFTASATDTKATIEAYFNNTAGKVAFAAGSAVQASVNAGVLSIANTNSPTLGFSAKKNLVVRLVQRYVVYVGSSIRAGNTYVLTVGTVTSTYTAVAGDTAASVAAGLGQPGSPFTIDVDTGTLVQAFARKGSAYGAGNVADVTLIGAKTIRNVARLAEVTVPPLPAGEYQFTLSDSQAGPVDGRPVLAVSNPVLLRPTTKDTLLLRYGMGDQGRVFGYDYQEDGLMQQLRIMAYLDAPLLKQEESLSRTLDDQTVRGRTRAYYVRKFTTTLQPDAFHRALYQALKHPVVLVGGLGVRCEGDYHQSDPQGKRRWMQAEAQLTELGGLDYVPDGATRLNSASGTYVLIGRLTGLDGLWVSVKRMTFVQPVETGTTLPAADYDLMIRTGHEPLTLTVGIDSRRVGLFRLMPDTLNRVGPVRLSPGELTLTARVTPALSVTEVADPYNPQHVTTGAVNNAETQTQPGDYNPDYNPDYSH